VLYFDLDEFKNVNDRLGHGIGDQVLIEISERALSATRDGDTVARLGGDEFAILMPGTDLVEAHALAEALREQLSHPMTIDGHALSLGASVGLVHALPGELSGEDALRNADVAMYLAKDRGKGTVAVYEPRLHAEALDRLQLSAELERAITHGGLVLHYQPTVDLSTGAIAGFEALVRWQHPVRGLLAPYTFIPLAEQTGLIQGLGSWVLRTACASAVELGKELPVWVKPPTMAVNVTAQQLAREDFVDEVLDVLRCSGLAPARLTIEITESVLMQDVTAVIARLGALRDLGIRIAIDDFGTGYSSLAYLRNLPLDILKVDKAFIDHVVTDAHDAALTGVILAMSAAMDLKTVGEGVEALDQAVWLTAANCDYGQGYYWSRPVPIEQARGLLRSPAFRRAGVPIELPSAAVAIG
jgi:diguanylate cyclase (GGDEF)-like protein